MYLGAKLVKPANTLRRFVVSVPFATITRTRVPRRLTVRWKLDDGYQKAVDTGDGTQKNENFLESVNNNERSICWVAGEVIGRT